MTGESDLDMLTRNMSATLTPGTYVFATVRGTTPDGLTPRMSFAEAEGTTLVLPLDQAQKAGITYEYPCRMITLEIHSALAAVGFLARITTALAAHGISVNPVSAFFHDHLFVPEDRADDAMGILRELAAG